MRAGRAALAGRRDVVPLAAELVVGDDDHRVLAAGAAPDRREQVDQVVAAAALAGVAGVLVLEPDRLDEAHRRDLAVLARRGDRFAERGLVHQVSAYRCPWSVG